MRKVNQLWGHVVDMTYVACKLLCHILLSILCLWQGVTYSDIRQEMQTPQVFVHLLTYCLTVDLLLCCVSYRDEHFAVIWLFLFYWWSYLPSYCSLYLWCTTSHFCLASSPLSVFLVDRHHQLLILMMYEISTLLLLLLKMYLIMSKHRKLLILLNKLVFISNFNVFILFVFFYSSLVALILHSCSIHCVNLECH